MNADIVKYREWRLTLPVGYFVDRSTGDLYFATEKADKRTGEITITPLLVSSPAVYVSARARDQRGGSSSKVIGWGDWNKKYQTTTVANADVFSSKLIRHLRNHGVRIPQRSVTLLREYIDASQPEELRTIVRRRGWMPGSFTAYVFGDTVLGNHEGETVEFVPEDGIAEQVFASQGTLEEYQRHVLSKCIGNSRLAFAVAAALCGPFLSVLGVLPFGFHYAGRSRKGKSTCLHLAVSVWSDRELMKKYWSRTDNSLTGLFANFEHNLLPLDEMGMQHDKEILSNMIYSLGNGTDKGRFHRDAVKAKIVVISTGEKTVRGHVQEKWMLGHDSRLIDIVANVSNDPEEPLGHGTGAFADTYKLAPGEFAETLDAETAKYFGVFGPALLRKLLASDIGEVKARLLREMKRFADEQIAHRNLPKSNGVIMAVLRCFALVAALGELATVWGLTGWPAGEAWRAADICFDSWLSTRDESELVEAPVNASTDMDAGVGQVLAWIEQNEARFSERRDTTEVPHRAGWKDDRQGRIEYHIDTNVFRWEACEGYNHLEVAQELRRLGMLICDSDGRLTRRMRIGHHYRPHIYSVRLPNRA